MQNWFKTYFISLKICLHKRHKHAPTQKKTQKNQADPHRKLLFGVWGVGWVGVVRNSNGSSTEFYFMKIPTKRRLFFFSFDIKLFSIHTSNSKKWLSLIYKTMRCHFRNNHHIKKSTQKTRFLMSSLTDNITGIIRYIIIYPSVRIISYHSSCGADFSTPHENAFTKPGNHTLPDDDDDDNWCGTHSRNHTTFCWYFVPLLVLKF